MVRFYYELRHGTTTNNQHGATKEVAPVYRGTNLNVILLLAALSALALCNTARAEFGLNFSGATSACEVRGNSNICGNTPFTLMGANQAGQYLIDPVNGLGYWHYILGDPAAGFAQEVYIRATASSCGQFTICSASAGATFVNAVNVLAPHATNNTGNGTGNPNNVIVREVMGGTWNAATSTWTCDTAYCSEFIKSTYANKPKITQGINDPAFSSTFILDMSSVSLNNNATTLSITGGSTGATGASLTYVVNVFDPFSASAFSYDMASDSQTTNVTASKYLYTTGAGVLGANGTYTYVDGDFNPRTFDYSPFLDGTVSNPWTYPANKP